MNCPTCQGTMSPKTVNTAKGTRVVQECNQDNGDCLNDKGYPTSVWPKGNGARAPQQQRRAAPPQQRAASNGDDRSSRIERQHSQEMALRYFDLRASYNEGEMPDTKEVRAMIDWFQRDVGHVPAPPQRRQEPEPPRDDPMDEHPMNPANQEGYGDDDEPPF